jgi:hypothetical protein
MVMRPVVADEFTTNVILLPVTIVNTCDTPFTLREFAFEKSLPLTVTKVPAGPDAGLIEVMAGGLFLAGAPEAAWATTSTCRQSRIRESKRNMAGLMR